MNILLIKLREVAGSVLPITALVLLLHFSIVPLPDTLVFRFLICALMIILGLAIFLIGVDISVQRMGELLGRSIARSKYPFLIGGVGFIIGFMITFAEPSLNILGQQIETASASAIDAQFFVAIVSVGVGFLLAIGFYRVLLNVSYRLTVALCYIAIGVMAVAVSPEFLAFSFDASGATTGALTTPFILALGLGISQLKKGKKAEDDAFGMVGMMSIGPIIAVMLMAILMNFGQFEPNTNVVEAETGIFWPIFKLIPIQALECLTAIAPVTIFFFIYNALKIRASRYDILQIIRGLIYAVIGLVLFLTAVNAGFLEAGMIVGKAVAKPEFAMALPFLGLALGLVVVFAEPAIYILSKQVQDVTGGHITRKSLLIALSLGVGVAVCLSMLRIILPHLYLWHILLPGFVLAVALSFYVPSLFVGIAFDAGGVASGPMTATFILALTQGAALSTPTADPISDGFGVIATVAMTPIVAILILGAFYKRKIKKLAIKQGVLP